MAETMRIYPRLRFSRKLATGHPDASRWAGFYKEARDVVEEMHQSTYGGHNRPSWEAHAHVLAVLSPRTSWPQNIRRAIEAARRAADLGYVQYVAEDFTETLPGLRMFRESVAVVYSGGVATGPKTSSFAANIIGDETKVTVDSWMARAYGCPDKFNEGQRDIITRSVTRHARQAGVTPAVMQAILWGFIREGHYKAWKE